MFDSDFLNVFPYMLFAQLTSDDNAIFCASFAKYDLAELVEAKNIIKNLMNDYLPDHKPVTLVRYPRHNVANAKYTLTVNLSHRGDPVFQSSFAEEVPSKLVKAKLKLFSLMDEYIIDNGNSVSNVCQPDEAKAADDHSIPGLPVGKQPSVFGYKPNKATGVGTAPASNSVPSPQKAEVKGLLLLHCPDCDSTFQTFLKAPKSEFVCKCGHYIDLTANMAKYEFVCPNCEKKTWGHTNLEDAEISVRCMCGSEIDLQWVSKIKTYRI